ncbi:MAG: AMP-binding protein, partial [Hyphomicrobiaceae bacterium]
DMAAFQYTSGTTRALPDAIRHTHRAIVVVMVAALYGTGIRPGQEFFCPSSPAWGHGMWHGTLAPLALGLTIGAYSGRFDAERLMKALQDYRITNLSAAATHYRLMKNSGAASRYKFHLEALSFTGEPLDSETRAFAEKTFGQAPRSFYGTTEIGVVLASYPGAADITVPDGALGLPMPGMKVEVHDHDGKQVAPGQTGEIVVLRRDNWVATKDLGRMDENGWFYHGGRADDVIISAGWTMGAVEIEDAILKHPEVTEAAVIGVPDTVRGQVVKAFIVTRRPGSDALAREIQDAVRERLSAHEYPRQIAFVSELPKTPAGKVNRKVLRDREAAARNSCPLTRIEAMSSERMFPKITDEALSDLRRRIDLPITDTIEPWCYEATRDNIRHYAHGIGDDNPMWCDPEYAAKARFGTIVAPPSFLFATDRIISGYVGGIPGVHAMWAGADWTWHLPLKRNDEIRTEAYLKDLVEHQTRFAGRAIQQIYHVKFYNQDRELVAEADSWCFRTDRDHAREEGTKYKDVKAKPPRRYTQDELDKVWDLYAKEEVRGATPRTYEDVAVGDKLPTMAKGPMTVTGFIAFAQGWGGLYIRANKLAWKMIHRHKGLGIPNRFGIPDCPERVHWEQDFALMVGAPGAYDYGPERCSWLTHHMTNWMGDDGFLRRASCKIRRHNPEGDLLFINGKVTGKRVENGRHLIDIEQEAHNQDGELSVLGQGTVELPSKG